MVERTSDVMAADVELTCADCRLFGKPTERIFGYSPLHICKKIHANGKTGYTKPTIPACRDFIKMNIDLLSVFDLILSENAKREKILAAITNYIDKRG